MDLTPDILLNDDIRKALVEGACPYVLSGGFRAEIESSEKVWNMLMQKVEENKQKENEKESNDLTTV